MPLHPGRTGFPAGTEGGRMRREDKGRGKKEKRRKMAGGEREEKDRGRKEKSVVGGGEEKGRGGRKKGGK